MPEVRNTRQKEAVLQAALASREHPTADMIYEAVRREVPGISLGTVYRNLQRLVSEGRLSLAPIPGRRSRRSRGRSTRFDPITGPHDHFVCQRCEGIHDVARDEGGTIDFRALERRGFRVESHTLSVYGVCAECTETPPRPEGRGAGRRAAR